MNPETSRYGRAHRIERERWKIAVDAGRARCHYCSGQIRPDEHWSMSSETRVVFHSRCGFRSGRLGEGVSREW
jgi:hypothetical protein